MENASEFDYEVYKITDSKRFRRIYQDFTRFKKLKETLMPYYR